MSIPDELLWEYTIAASGLAGEEMTAVLHDLKSMNLGPDENGDKTDLIKLPPGIDINSKAVGTLKPDPYMLKQQLAKQIVTRYCGNARVAEDVCQQFLTRFRDHQWPSLKELIETEAGVMIENEVEWLPRIIVHAGAARSNGEAQRLIKAGAVAIDGKKVGIDQDHWDITLDKPFVLKVGKRRFFAIYHDRGQLTDLDRYSNTN